MNHPYDMINKADNKVHDSLLDNTAPGAVPGDPITDKNPSPEMSVITTQLLMRVT